MTGTKAVPLALLRSLGAGLGDLVRLDRGDGPQVYRVVMLANEAQVEPAGNRAQRRATSAKARQTLRRQR